MSATNTKTAILKVPGASLYYEITGSGPLLLLIPGAPADAGGFAGIAGQPGRPLTSATTYLCVTDSVPWAAG
jgi:hypothetical protein